MKYAFIISTLLSLSLCLAAESRQLIAGAGPSTELVKLFFNELGKQEGFEGYNFIVPTRSIKHAGGIKASDKYIFGRTGRPLSEAEKKQGKAEIILAGMPLVFVTGSSVPLKSMSYQQLESVYGRKIKNWKEISGVDAEIILVGRETTEASLSVLRQSFPFLDTSDYDIVFARDHRVVNFISSKAGQFALAFGAKANFDGLNVVQAENYKPAIQLGLIYDFKNRHHPLVIKAIEFSKTDKWRSVAIGNGYLINKE